MEEKKPRKKLSLGRILHSVSHVITSSIQGFFYRLGWAIGTRPWTFVVGMFCFTILCLLGGLRFRRETRPERLWVPFDSHFYNASVWLMENFPSPIRFQYVIIEADDVLEPHVLQQVVMMHKKVEQVTAYGKNWEDLCFRLPVVRLSGDSANLIQGLNQIRIPRSIDDFDDLDFPNDTFDDFDSSKWLSANTNNESTKKPPPELAVYNFSKEFKNFEDGLSKGVQWKTIDDISVALPVEMYCSLIDSVHTACWMQSITEIWGYDADIVSNLTKQDIIEAVNTPTLSPVYGTPLDYRFLLGTPTINESGYIVSAKAMMVRWFTAVNLSDLDSTFELLDTGLGDPADKISLQWELNFLDTILGLNLTDNVKAHVRAWRSFADVGGQGMVNDIFLLIPGYGLILTYMVLMLSEWNWTGMRPLSSGMGLLATFGSFCISVGLCSMFGIEYTPIHNMLGFLLVGLGVDDVFVITQCWVNLSDQDKDRSLPEKMALTMKDAGMAISVTSFTDALAFMVGATTLIPALRSFCIYATIGILSIYVFQATFYAGWFVIEERWRERWRSRQLSKMTLKEAEGQMEKKSGEKGTGWLGRYIMDTYAKHLLTPWGMIVGFLASIALLSAGSIGLANIRQEFDPIWFLPKESYLMRFADALYFHFPSDGEEAYVFIANANYSLDLPVLDQLVSDMKNSPFDIQDVDDWYTDFRNHSNRYFDAGIPETPISEDYFRFLLGRYLFSQVGGRHQKSFEFDGELKCGKPTPPVLATRIPFRFQHFNGPSEHIPAMRRVRHMINSLPFKTSGAWAFVWSYLFCVWEVDEVIGVELTRNLILASVCVFGTTLVLLADIRASVLVVVCVALAVGEVTGFMYFFHLTIDSVSCIGVVLAVGMCVDYAAHVAHAFVHLDCGEKMDKQSRARGAVRMIGPAVVHGVFSTFLAMVCLVASTSHVFTTFFRLFMILLSLGMFHGLVLLPILLTLFGPPPIIIEDLHFTHPSGIFSTSSKHKKQNGDASRNGNVVQETTMQLQALLQPQQATQNSNHADDSAQQILPTS